MRTHGGGASRYEVLRTGRNGRLDTLQAAGLLAKLDSFKEELARREAIATQYDKGLAGHVQVPVRVADSRSAWAIYAILLGSTAERDVLQVRMKEQGVPSAIYYPLPLHKQPAYRDHHDGSALPVSEDLAQRILALPIHPELSNEDVARVIAAAKG